MKEIWERRIRWGKCKHSRNRAVTSPDQSEQSSARLVSGTCIGKLRRNPKLLTFYACCTADFGHCRSGNKLYNKPKISKAEGWVSARYVSGTISRCLVAQGRKRRGRKTEGGAAASVCRVPTGWFMPNDDGSDDCDYPRGVNVPTSLEDDISKTYLRSNK